MEPIVKATSFPVLVLGSWFNDDIGRDPEAVYTVSYGQRLAIETECK